MNLLLCDVCSLAESPAANRKVLGDTIVIHNAKASDSAVYQCEAANVHGKLLSNANIMIMSEFADGKTINKKTFESSGIKCCEFPPSLPVVPGEQS